MFGVHVPLMVILLLKETVADPLPKYLMFGW